MLSSNSICAAVAALALAAPGGASAQPLPVPAPLQEAGAANFTIFLRGAPIGSEQMALTRVAAGWTIVSSGRLGAPMDVAGRRVQVRYTAEWRPLEFTFEGTVRGQAQTVRTVIEGTTAKSDISIAGQAQQKTDTIDPNAILLLPNSFFAPYEAVAARLKTAGPGSEIPVYL